MTNYNKRLDEILCDTLNGEGVYREYSGKVKAAGQDAAKQALTSLIKELVAEARIDEVEKVKLVTYREEMVRYADKRIAKLEQDLLKALEGKL